MSMRILCDAHVANSDEQKLTLQASRLESVRSDVLARAKNSEATEAFLDTDFALHEYARAEAWWRSFGGNITDCIVIGIGGSTNASKAVYDALPAREGGARLRFLETVDDKEYEELERFIASCAPQQLGVVVISKSGATIEVLANTAYVRSMVKRLHGREAHVGVITLTDTPLARMAQKMQWPHLLSHEAIPDRYAAFSVITLVPLVAAGVDVRAYTQGLTDGLLLGREVMRTATIRAIRYHAGDRVQDVFFFHPELEALGKWQRALIAESIGKALTTQGKPTHIALEPVVSIGTQDLHAVLQLRFGSATGTLTIFVVTDDLLAEGGRVQAVLFQSIQSTYADRKLPFYTIALSGVSEREIGAFMAYAMQEIILLSALLEVNPFDQPEVEGYKERAREAIAAQEDSA